MRDIPTFIGMVHQGKVRPDFPSQFRAYLAPLENHEIEFQVRKRKEKRSGRQNRALWALLSEWAREKGHNVNDLKDDVMGEVFGWGEPSPLTGRCFPREPHSSTLTVTEFCHLIEEILRLAAENGMYLMAPDEYRKAKEQAQKQAAKAAGKAA